MQFIELYIGTIILWTVAYYIGKLILKRDKKENIFKVILIIMIFALLLSLLNVINSEVLGGIPKILCVYTLQYLYYRFMFQESHSKSMIVALIYYICLCISEVIVAIVISIMFYIINKPISILKNTIIIDILITSTEYIIVYKFKNLLSYLLKDGKISKGTFVINVIVLVTLSLLIFKIPLVHWQLNFEFVVTMLILLGFCVVGLTLMKQKAQIQETTSKYQQLANYSDVTNDLLEEYRIVAHEHKNQLSAIKNMLEDNAPDISDYIDTLLEKRGKLKYYWIEQLNHLPLSGLKGLINYKLMEMESKKLDVNINVSKEVTKTNLPKLTIKQKDSLYSIMGVYLDNAIQAAEVSKKKEISLEIFKENKDVVIIIANTYNGKIDLEKIDEYGYSTKGKNHGVGLHIVKKILEEESVFSQNRNILEDYYVQELRIHLEEIKKIEATK